MQHLKRTRGDSEQDAPGSGAAPSASAAAQAAHDDAPAAKRSRFGPSIGGPAGGPGRGGRDDNRKYEWGNPDQIRADEEERQRKLQAQQAGPMEKPSLGLSGKLAADTNTVAGTDVVLKWSPPPESRVPDRRWRLYVLKGGELLQEPVQLQDKFALFGRDRLVVQVPLDHPSCSKQHAVLCFRQVSVEEDFRSKLVIRPYVIDLQSTNGTFVNGRRIEDSRYYELREFDLLRFGESTRDFVLMHEDSNLSDFAGKRAGATRPK